MNVDEILGVLPDVPATLEVGHSVIPAVPAVAGFPLKTAWCVVPVTAQHRADHSPHHKTQAHS